MVKDGIYLSGRYQVLSKIGAGGMADVYKAKDCMLNRYVAVKVLKKEYREDENFVKKFRSEAQAAAGLLNPNIVNVYDVGEDRGLYYMVMELVEGITLKEYVHKKGKLSSKEAISIAIQMCTGIEAAHNHHIIHRDIKPQNIIISKEGKVKVTDFGIAKATTSQTVSTSAMGSVHYVSPEQARGGYCDEKSDIYSAGITMYEMVTGRVPFDGDSTVSVAMKHLQENITPPSEYTPDLYPALEKIILKCTQKSAERRYQSAGELIQDLKRALVDPSGEFVDMVPIRSMGDTVMISPERMARMKKRQGDGYDDEEYDDGYDDEEYDENDDYDEDDEEDNYNGGRRGNSKNGVDPKMNKMMKILMVAVAVIVAFALIFLIGKAAGVFGKRSDSQISVSNEIEVPNLVGQPQNVAETMCEKKQLKLEVESEKASDDISLFEAEFIKIHLYILFYSNCSGNDILIRMMSCLFLIDSSQTNHLFYQGMVSGKLPDILIQKIQTAVTYIYKIKCMIDHSCRNQSGSHPLQINVFICFLDQLVVRCLSRIF